MRYRDIILEYDQAKTAARYGKKLWGHAAVHERRHGIFDKLVADAEHLFSDQEKVPAHVIPRLLTHIEKYDPTPNRQYVQWIVQRYCDGGIRYLEDLAKVTTALEGFHDMKTKGWFKRNPDQAPKADIGQWKNLSDLWDFVWHAHNGGVISNGEQERRAKKEALKSSDVLYDGPKYMVVSPKSAEAAMYWGRNTAWCTSGEQDNAFESYNRSAPLYIIIDKPNNRRWQMWFDEHNPQCMDELDEEIVWDEFPEEIWMLFKWPEEAKATIIRNLDVRLAYDKESALADYLSLDDLVAAYFHASIIAQRRMGEIIQRRSEEAIGRGTPVSHEGREIGHVYRLGDALALAMKDYKPDGFIARFQSAWYSVEQAVRGLGYQSAFFGEIEGAQGRAVMSQANALLDFYTAKGVKAYQVFRPNTVSQDVTTIALAIRANSTEMQKGTGR